MTPRDVAGSASRRTRGRRRTGPPQQQSCPRQARSCHGPDRAEDRRIFADTGRTGLDRAGSATPPAHASLAPEALAGAGFRQRPADFEAEVVHRGLLAHAQILALRLTFGLLGRPGDVDGDLRLDLRVEV